MKDACLALVAECLDQDARKAARDKHCVLCVDVSCNALLRLKENLITAVDG